MFDVNNVSDSLKKLRRELNLSQNEFSVIYRIPIKTLRNWEQGKRVPDNGSLSYLVVIEAIPEEVFIILQKTPSLKKSVKTINFFGIDVPLKK